MTTYLYFERDADINKIIRYIKNGEYPNDVDTKEKQSKFRRKFKAFKIIDNKLVYVGI